MVRLMSKKSIAYLLMSLTIMGIVVANTMVFSNRFKKVESSSVEVVGNEFVETVILDMSTEGLEKFMEAASKKALEYISGYIADGGTLDNIEEAFDSLVLNGSLNRTLQYKSPTLKTFLGITTNYYFVLGFRVGKVSIISTISQTDPWNVLVDSMISYKVIVPRTKFSWVVDTNKFTNVNIFGFDDPESGQKITNQWKHNDTYPSFMDRLEGETGGNPLGICRFC